jgi:hypothetical protein
VIRPLWFVTTRSFKNRLLSRLRKLRSPRYAVSMAAGLAYLWFFAIRRTVMTSSGPHFSLPATGFVLDIVSLLALAAMIFVWALPEQGGGLTFTESEVQFLFPAPIRRRDLLLYKILRQQPSLLISTAMMTLFGFRHARFVGLWMAFVVLSIYFTMVSLGRARLKSMRIGFFSRLLIVCVATAAIVILLVNDARGTFSGWTKSTDVGEALRTLPSMFHTPWVKTLLFVPRIFAGAAQPLTIQQLLISCGSLMVLGVVFFEVAAKLNVSFEDASLEASQKHADTAANSRRVGRRVMFRRIPPPFRLKAAGPEVAIAWKNLTAALRMSIGFVVIILAIFGALIADSAIVGSQGMHMGVTALGLMLAALFPFLGSQALRQDLRLDLPRIELLKSYPIRGDRLVLAEIAAPAIVVSIVEIIILSATAITSHFTGSGSKLAFIGSPEFIIIALLFAIPICLAQLLIQNAVVILIPGWAIQSGEETRGFVNLGQRLVILGGNLLVLAVGLLPAALVFAPLYLLARHFGSNAFVLAMSTAPAIAVLLTEIWIAVKFLGAQFDQIDITNEIDAAL